MDFFKKLRNFYIGSSIHVSLAICALAGITDLTFGLQFEWKVFAFLFLASVTGYNFVKYSEQAKLHHRSLTDHLRTIQVFSLVCFIGLVYVTFLQSIKVIVTTGILGVFTFFYAVPFLPNQKNLRSLKSLKIFIIGLVWAGATLWMPMVNQRPLSAVFSVDILLRTLAYFAFVLALMMPFEIRDLKYDASGLGTVPQRFGIPKTKLFGYILLMLFIALTVFTPSGTLEEIIINSSVALLVAVFIFFSKEYQSRFYTAFWVEAVPIFWFLALLVIG